MKSAKENDSVPAIEINDRVELVKSVMLVGVIYQAGALGLVTGVSRPLLNVIFDGMNNSTQIHEQYLKKRGARANI